MMVRPAVATDQQLKDVRLALAGKYNPLRSWQIAAHLKQQGIVMDESTIRGRFIEMGNPLGGAKSTGLSGGTEVATSAKPVVAKPVTQAIPGIGKSTVPPVAKPTGVPGIAGIKPVEPAKPKKKYEDYPYPPELKSYIKKDDKFKGYVERPIDKRLGIHYESQIDALTYPISQGKQGCGKSMSHAHYAWKNAMPHIEISCTEDLKLNKLFGDKTIKNGSVVFQEGLFVKAIQHPTVITFEEFNYITNVNSVDFHAFLQVRELFIKDADDGNGKTYRMHPECKVGFAMNPKSAKYIGGQVKPSNFLGRCTYLSYPEFTKEELMKSMLAKYGDNDNTRKFTQFFSACVEALERANVPVDISIRQLHNMLTLSSQGMSVRDCIFDGLISILDSVSQPDAKQPFEALAIAVWGEKAVKMNQMLHFEATPKSLVIKEARNVWGDAWRA